ncbi:Dps family protein [Robertmurraya kyonggiensis]|uniref:DNA starvation/stationary phase protection protein n=1 Tax=Robertmurraya kyonggiensis TaxID=1037680 RepID=A0A4U1D119_9BACI|nr:Dps family protein [Robertmurraya kyonggiensis]TKC15902.1 DNA starvation/stationary phase protection protein [Robertmurraya kyonggiensis]
MKNSLDEILNKQISNWSVLYVKLHNFHWYVKGTEFFTLHAKFEEYYNSAAIHIDELAERLLAIGGQPVATMNEYLEKSSIKEATTRESATEMVETLVDDFSIIIEEVKNGMGIAEELEDETTGDMLLAIHSELEKNVWMLKAFLGKSA